MATAQELRECLRDRALANIAYSVRSYLKRERKEDLELGKKLFAKVTFRTFRKYFGPDRVNLYLEEHVSPWPFDKRELIGVKKMAKLIDINTSDPFINSLRRLHPDLKYKNGPERMPCTKLPGPTTLQIGWRYVGNTSLPELHVLALGELHFIGEDRKKDKLYRVYYGMPVQMFTRKDGLVVAQSWDMERGTALYAKEVMKRQY